MNKIEDYNVVVEGSSIRIVAGTSLSFYGDMLNGSFRIAHNLEGTDSCSNKEIFDICSKIVCLFDELNTNIKNL